jgi:hypothetical protein
MIWSKEHLQSFDEKTLSTKVLISLFEAMKFRDVTFHHGGALEQGKDLVMWRSEAPRERVNYAVIVKIERISGSVASAGGVLTQIKQAFGMPFIDKKTHEEFRVNHCFIVTSREILKEGTHSLRALLSADNLLDRVTLIDGDALLGLLEKFLPQSLTLSKLREGFDSLPRVPEHDLRVEVTKEGVAFTVVPESESSNLLKFNLMPVFKDTPEGRDKMKEYETFINTGAPVEFDEKTVQSIQFPAVIRHLFPVDATSFQLILGPAQKTKLTIVALELVAPDGESFQLPYIDFSSVQSGQEEIKISNDKQPIPFHISLTMRKMSPEGNFDYSFPLAGEGIHWMAQSLEFERILAKGPAIHLRDLQTGLRYHVFDLPVRTINSPDERLVELVKRVVRIQELTHTAITVPDRDFFTEEDYENIRMVEHVIESGRYPVENALNQVAFTLSSKQVLDQAAIYLQEPLGNISLTKPFQNHRILDTQVPLGPIKINCLSPQIMAEDRSQLESIVRGESYAQTANIRLVPQEGGSFDLRFLNWPVSFTQKS